MASKQLVIICADGIKGLLHIHQDDTIADMRIRTHKELNDDLITTPTFGFRVNKLYIRNKRRRGRMGTWSMTMRMILILVSEQRHYQGWKTLL